MKFTKKSLTLLAVASLLSLSLSSQAQTNTPPAGGPGNRPGGPGGRGAAGNVDMQMTRLNEQLKLTDEQKPKVKAVLEEQNKTLAGLRDLSPEDRRTKFQSVREESNKKMKAILTTDQFKKFEELQQQRGQRRNGGPGAPGGGGQNRNGGNAGNPGGAQQ